MFPPLRVEETVLTRFYGRVQAPVNEETLFPGMFPGRANERETMFPCHKNQETFHWKQTFAHVQFRKYSLHDHRIQSTWFPLRANGQTFVAETKCFRRKSETFFVSRKQNMFLQQMFLSRANEETLRETCFLNNVSPFAAALSCIY